MLSVIGFAIIIIMLYLLLSNKTLPINCFIILPIVGALIAGFSIAELSDFIKKGVGTTWATAVLFIFSVLYFGIMNDVGLFDKLVEKLIKIAGKNVVAIMLATSLIGMVAHINGAGAATYLITIPAMLPIYKKMHLRPTVLLLLIGASCGVLNLVPWGGPTIRAATAVNMDATQLWMSLIPMQVAGMLLSLCLALLFGHIESKRLAAEGISLDHIFLENQEATNKDADLKRPRLLPYNILLTAAVIVMLVVNWIPSYATFMIGTVCALTVNYPQVKLQQERILAHAPSAMLMSAILLGAGVFLGVFVNSGMIEAMAVSLIQILPGGLQKYLHYIVGAFAAPIGMVVGPDPYYYGIMPIVGEIVGKFGVPMDAVARTMLIGENIAFSVSPVVPSTFLAIGLSGVELRDHIKFSFKWLWGISVIMLAVGAFLGVI